MEKRFSEMSKEELDHQLIKLKEAAMKKHQAGFYSEAAVYEQKFYMAKSYLLNPADVIPGKEYKVVGYEQSFLVSYLNGVMAWGRLSGSDEEIAMPIARLELK